MASIVAGLAAPWRVRAQAPAAVRPPLKIVVGFPPGGSADVLAHTLADAMRPDFSGVAVRNLVGDAGRMAIGAVRDAAPDGETLLLTPSGPMVVSPLVYRRLGYDPMRDFTPISLVTRFQFGLLSGPSTAVSSVKEMIVKAKSDPANATYGSPGAGSITHFLGVMLAEKAGVPLVHVPFQGAEAAQQALRSGRIGYRLDVVSEVADLHRAGVLRIVAVTGAARDPQVPDVPTLKEQGVDMEVAAFFALYGPAGLASAKAKQLHQSVSKALKLAGVAQRLGGLGYEVVGSTGDELSKAQKIELARWEKPIRSTGLRID
ncbi:MAG: tripartite tricarboxylate transporter substrate-binding protein [Lautropia sp.]